MSSMFVSGQDAAKIQEEAVLGKPAKDQRRAGPQRFVEPRDGTGGRPEGDAPGRQLGRFAGPALEIGHLGNLFVDANIAPDELNQFAFASRKLPEYMHWRLWECRQCDLLYANPAPTTEQLASLYRDAAFGSAAEAGYAAKTYGGLLRRTRSAVAHRSGALISVLETVLSCTSCWIRVFPASSVLSPLQPPFAAPWTVSGP